MNPQECRTFPEELIRADHWEGGLGYEHDSGSGGLFWKWWHGSTGRQCAEDLGGNKVNTSEIEDLGAPFCVIKQ